MSKRMIGFLVAYLAAIALAGAMLLIMIRQSLLAITPVPIDSKRRRPDKGSEQVGPILAWHGSGVARSEEPCNFNEDLRSI